MIQGIFVFFLLKYSYYKIINNNGVDIRLMQLILGWWWNCFLNEIEKKERELRVEFCEEEIEETCSER